jgi:hypothetical protein
LFNEVFLKLHQQMDGFDTVTVTFEHSQFSKEE